MAKISREKVATRTTVRLHDSRVLKLSCIGHSEVIQFGSDMSYAYLMNELRAAQDRIFLAVSSMAADLMEDKPHEAPTL